MNWRKGFFRISIVGSLLWVACGFLTHFISYGSNAFLALTDLNIIAPILIFSVIIFISINLIGAFMPWVMSGFTDNDK